MAMKIIGFLIKVIKLAIDTFVEKPVKLRRRVPVVKPNKKVMVVGAVLVGFAAVVFLLRWFLRPLPSEAKPEKEIRRLPREESIEVEVFEEVPPSATAGPSPDDLTLISGIGPKTANMLINEGITTYRQLAEKSQEDLTELLKKSGFRIVNPATWPKQAALVAAGDWDGLKNYLDELKHNQA